MAKFVALLSLIALSVLCNVGVSIYGWGLHPRSWGWIIGVGFGLQVIVQVVTRHILKDE